MLNKTLKTYPDGSRLTTGGAMVAAAFTLVVTAAAGTATVAIQNWKAERNVKKHKLGKYAN